MHVFGCVCEIFRGRTLVLYWLLYFIFIFLQINYIKKGTNRGEKPTKEKIGEQEKETTTKPQFTATASSTEGPQGLPQGIAMFRELKKPFRQSLREDFFLLYQEKKMPPLRRHCR